MQCKRCGLLLQMEQRGLSVWSGHVNSWALQKRLNPSGCRLKGRLGWAKQYVLDGGRDPIPHRKGQFGGLPAHRKALGVNAAAVYPPKINNDDSGTAGGRMQCCRLYDVTLHCFHMKNPPLPAMQPFVKISWPLVNQSSK